MNVSRFGRFTHDMLGRSDRHLIEALIAQTRAAVAGIAIAQALSAARISTTAARDAIARVEHDGDNARAEVVAALSVSLTSPIDREDLYRLSRCIDDVLDSVRDFVREAHLYRATPDANVLPALDALEDGMMIMSRATAAILSDRRAVAPLMLAAKKAASRVRRCYQAELAALFSGALTMQVLKNRELLRRLDIAGLRLGEAADALGDALVKRGR